MQQIKPSSSPLFLISFLLISTHLLPPSLSFHGDEDVFAFVYAGCSQLKYTSVTPYQYNLNNLLASLVDAAGFSNYANFTSSLASFSAPVYGLYQCRGDLSVPSCDSCVKSSVNQLSNLCSSSCSGALQLHGCFVRYGNESFLGQPDKTVLFKKCGSATGGAGNGADVMGMRDSVMKGLVGGAGPYRVSQAGYIDGTAQCVEDINGKECTDCVTSAVGNLQSECSGAVSGEAYLGKCYARFYTYGVSSKSDHHDSRDDEVGKTLAIIIGLLAGVVLIVIFLSFIRRPDGEGKH